MKKAVLFVLVLLSITAFTILSASAGCIEQGSSFFLELPGFLSEAKLPSSLEIIEDEAFEGTALVNVELSDRVVEIGEHAFAYNASLRNIRIPIITSYIASTAFEGNSKVTITAPENSYARAFAQKHGLPFSPIVMVYASTQTTATSPLSFNESKEVIGSDSLIELKPENQWKRIEIIKLAQIQELIANYAQGRSPPIV